jgi:anaerobic magnesium-protoporphyrin IX monomethyl ester cyclase
MSIKVLLALPIREGDNIQISPDPGILYLGTALKKKGIDVTLLDCPKEQMTYRSFRAYLESNPFDVVGFRCFSRDHNYVIKHLEVTRRVLPDALTLVGGPHSSALPEYVMSSMPHLDFAWRAEAEEGLPSLLTMFEKCGRQMPEAQLKCIEGLVWRNSAGETVLNPVHFGDNLDSYGIPAWELIKPETYPGFIWDRFYPIVTTRGCPFPCTYCNTPGLSGKKLRHRSVEHVLEELRVLKKSYSIARFSIGDDEFTLDRPYVVRFCEALIHSGLNLHWDCPVGVRLDAVDPELLQLMEKAGCESLAVGIESGNERVQKVIQKKVTVQKIREQARMIANCSGIQITGFFMIGFPDETEEEIWDTLRLANELPLKRANFNVVMPIPGTAIFNEAIRTGTMSLDKINWDALTHDQISFQRKHISGTRLIELQRKAFLRFYRRPHILWYLLKESLKNREIIRASLRKLRMLGRRTETIERTPLYLRDFEV